MSDISQPEAVARRLSGYLVGEPVWVVSMMRVNSEGSNPDTTVHAAEQTALDHVAEYIDGELEYLIHLRVKGEVQAALGVGDVRKAIEVWNEYKRHAASPVDGEIWVERLVIEP